MKSDFAEHLDAALRQALRAQGEAVALAVRAAVPASERIGVQAAIAAMLVRSPESPAAAREFGRPGSAPRPVLGPAAAARGAEAARQVGVAAAEAIAAAFGRA